MVEKEKYMGKSTFYCECCGLHYEDEETAQECERNCELHNRCQLEVTQKALENKKKG